MLQKQVDQNAYASSVYFRDYRSLICRRRWDYFDASLHFRYFRLQDTYNTADAAISAAAGDF